MNLLPGAKLMHLNPEKLENDDSNTLLWVTDGPPKTHEEAKRCLRSLIWNMIEQYMEENGEETTIELLNRAQQEKCPELPIIYQGEEIPIADWAWEASCATDLKWGLNTAVEHPEWLEEANPEDYDLYWLILETIP